MGKIIGNIMVGGNSKRFKDSVSKEAMRKAGQSNNKIYYSQFQNKYKDKEEFLL